jgi:hypothetical protein
MANVTRRVFYLLLRALILGEVLMMLNLPKAIN